MSTVNVKVKESSNTNYSSDTLEKKQYTDQIYDLEKANTNNYDSINNLLLKNVNNKRILLKLYTNDDNIYIKKINMTDNKSSEIEFYNNDANHKNDSIVYGLYEKNDKIYGFILGETNDNVAQSINIVKQINLETFKLKEEEETSLISKDDNKIILDNVEISLDTNKSNSNYKDYVLDDKEYNYTLRFNSYNSKINYTIQKNNVDVDDSQEKTDEINLDFKMKIDNYKNINIVDLLDIDSNSNKVLQIYKHIFVNDKLLVLLVDLENGTIDNKISYTIDSTQKRFHKLDFTPSDITINVKNESLYEIFAYDFENDNKGTFHILNFPQKFISEEASVNSTLLESVSKMMDTNGNNYTSKKSEFDASDLFGQSKITNDNLKLVGGSSLISWNNESINLVNLNSEEISIESLDVKGELDNIDVKTPTIDASVDNSKVTIHNYSNKLVTHFNKSNSLKQKIVLELSSAIKSSFLVNEGNMLVIWSDNKIYTYEWDEFYSKWEIENEYFDSDILSMYVNVHGSYMIVALKNEDDDKKTDIVRYSWKITKLWKEINRKTISYVVDKIVLSNNASYVAVSFTLNTSKTKMNVYSYLNGLNYKSSFLNENKFEPIKFSNENGNIIIKYVDNGNYKKITYSPINNGWRITNSNTLDFSKSNHEISYDEQTNTISIDKNESIDSNLNVVEDVISKQSEIQQELNEKEYLYAHDVDGDFTLVLDEEEDIKSIQVEKYVDDDNVYYYLVKALEKTDGLYLKVYKNSDEMKSSWGEAILTLGPLNGANGVNELYDMKTIIFGKELTIVVSYNGKVYLKYININQERDATDKEITDISRTYENPLDDNIEYGRCVELSRYPGDAQDNVTYLFVGTSNSTIYIYLGREVRFAVNVDEQNQGSETNKIINCLSYSDKSGELVVGYKDVYNNTNKVSVYKVSTNSNDDITITLKEHIHNSGDFTNFGKQVVTNKKGDIIVVSGEDENNNRGNISIYTKNANDNYDVVPEIRLGQSKDYGDSISLSENMFLNNPSSGEIRKLIAVSNDGYTNINGDKVGRVYFYVYDEKSTTSWVLFDMVTGDNKDNVLSKNIDLSWDGGVCCILNDKDILTTIYKRSKNINFKVNQINESIEDTAIKLKEQENDIIQQKNELQKTKEELEANKTKLEGSLKATRTELQNDLSNNEQVINEQGIQLNAQKVELNDLTKENGKISVINTNITTINTNLDTLESGLNNLLEDVENITKTNGLIDVLETKVDNNDEKHTDALNGMSTTLQRLINDNKEILNVITDTSNGYLVKINENIESIQDVNTGLAKLNSSLNDSNTNIGALKTTLTDVERDSSHNINFFTDDQKVSIKDSGEMNLYDQVSIKKSGEMNLFGYNLKKDGYNGFTFINNKYSENSYYKFDIRNNSTNLGYVRLWSVGSEPSVCIFDKSGTRVSIYNSGGRLRFKESARGTTLEIYDNSIYSTSNGGIWFNNGSIIPVTSGGVSYNNALDIGSDSTRFRNGFFGGFINITGGTLLSADGFHSYMLWDTDSSPVLNTFIGNYSFYVSLSCRNTIVTNSYLISSTSLVYSDKRIKTNIEDVPDNLALQKVRDIPCRYYEYKDKLSRGAGKTIGYIAQEVKEVLPMAVRQKQQVLPNELHVIQNPVWEELDDGSGNKQYVLKVSSSDFTDTEYQDENGETNISGVNYEFYVSNDDLSNIDFDNVNLGSLNLSQEEIIKVSGNEDNKSFTFEKRWNNVFMYGREVDDFLCIDKQKICALHHASIQEIDRLQTANTERIRVLEEENKSLKSEVDTLKAELQAIKTHLGL